MIVTSQESIFSKELTQQEISMPQFFRGMEKMHNERHETKEGLYSFNLVEFDSPTNKKEHGIVSIHGQILDFDGCECDIQEVLEFFSDYSYVAYSSFNNGKKGRGSRFRLVLPYDVPIANMHYTAQKNVYEHVFDIFADQLQHLPTGLDTSKRNPGAFYFRPCMTDFPIFRMNVVEPLNWRELVETERSKVIMQRKLQQKAEIEEKQRKLEEIKREKAATLTPEKKDKAAANSLEKFRYQGTGTGNSQFFKYAKSLAGKGFDNMEIAQLLRDNANQFGNVEERLKEIPHILKSI